jgi:hypothetical protein
MKDGRCLAAVGPEGHAVVVEFRTRMEFVDSGFEGGFPDLEADFYR